MLVVKIELHSAITRKVTVLGQMVIANRGTQGDPAKGSYSVAVANKAYASYEPSKVYHETKYQARQGEVLNYPRLSYNVWRLVARALLSAFPEESKKGKAQGFDAEEFS